MQSAPQRILYWSTMHVKARNNYYHVRYVTLRVTLAGLSFMICMAVESTPESGGAPPAPSILPPSLKICNCSVQNMSQKTCNTEL
jgi:hypothetical protein